MATLEKKLKPLARGVFSGWFFPTGTRKRLSFFLSLLITLGVSLIGCTITRQFPLFENSKEFFFKKQNTSFSNLPFCVKFKNIYYLREIVVNKLQKTSRYFWKKVRYLFIFAPRESWMFL
jgi:hypothetical protein